MIYEFTDTCTALGKVIQKENFGFSFLCYLLKGKKNVLIDTVPERTAKEFWQELQSILKNSIPDALILNHSEEDHSGALPLILKEAPDIPIFCTPACRDRLVTAHPAANFIPVEHSSRLTIGDFHFQFIHTPGMHWEDNMVTWFENERILFSNDLFGQYLGNTPPIDNTQSAANVTAAAADYFHKVFTAATSEEKNVVSNIAAYTPDYIAPGHGIILKNHIPEFLSGYIETCQQDVPV